MSTGHDNTKSENSIRQVRRRLLKLGVYAPPAILGVMISGVKIAEAGTPIAGQTKNCGNNGIITVSANGNACCPCARSSPTNPSYKCLQTKCLLGNCSACSALTFRSKRKCNEKLTKRNSKASNCGICQKVNGVWVIR